MVKNNKYPKNCFFFTILDNFTIIRNMFDITFSIIVSLILINYGSASEYNLLQQESTYYNQIVSAFYKIIISYCFVKFIIFLMYCKKMMDNTVDIMAPYVYTAIFIWFFVF